MPIPWLMVCLLVGFFLSLSNLQIALELGMTVGVGMLAAISLTTMARMVQNVLRRSNRLNRQDLACAISLTSGMSFGSCSIIGSALAAIYLRPEEPPPVWQLTCWMMGLCGLGTCIALYLRESALSQAPFPSGQSMANLITQLIDGTSQRLFHVIAGLTTMVIVLRDGFAVLATQIGRGFPLSINLSPMILGLGILLGLHTATSMLLGSLASVLMSTQTGDQAQIHSFAISILIGSSLVDCSSYFKQLKAPSQKNKIPIGTRPLVLSIGLILLGATDSWSTLVTTLICIPLCVLFGLMAIHATGHTDVVPTGPLGKISLLVMGFTGPEGPGSRLIGAGLLAGSAAAGSDAVTDFRCGQLLGCPTTRQFRFQFSGSLLGAFLLTPIASYLLTQSQHRFLAPGAQIWLSVIRLESSLASHTIWMVAGALIGLLVSMARQRKSLQFLPNPTALAIAFFLSWPICLGVFIGAICGSRFGVAKGALIGTTMMGVEGALQVIALLMI